MREIKFRAWHPEEQKMWEDIGVCGGDALLDTRHMGLQPLKGATMLMQYTGLKDKNGVEIYEGDVVKELCPYWAGKDDFYWVGKVVYVLNPLGFIYEWETTRGVDSRRLELRNYRNLEVIGNIYQNKELLDG